MPTGRAGRSILVVDDDATMRWFHLFVLRGEGHRVDAAVDGQAGWEALQRGTYDLLVTDNDMPRLTGLELAARVREAGLSIPIILATGSAAVGGVEDHPALRLAAILIKPFSAREMITRVRSVLGPAAEMRESAPVLVPALTV
jgi:CheY-like chemotaxis protein